jgi:hypothetical protein
VRSRLKTSSIKPIHVLVVQDHPLLATAIAAILESQDDMSACGVARSGDEAPGSPSRRNPQLCSWTELIRAVGPERVEKVSESHGELSGFRKLQMEPHWRGRPLAP